MAVSGGAKLQIGLALSMVAFWGAILGWTLVADPGDPRDFLDDRAFPAAAEPLCAAAMAEVEALGSAAAVDTIEERADLVDSQNEIFTPMVDELRGLPIPSGEQGGWVREWLDDWDVHIGDRARWADLLHAGEDPAFVETAKGNEQISEAIDGFAEVNEMPSCATFDDL